MIPEKVPIIYEDTCNTVYVFHERALRSIAYEHAVGMENRLIDLHPHLIVNDDYAGHRLAGAKWIRTITNDNVISEDHKKNQIIRISKTLGILSKYTSYIGVEVKDDVDKQTNQPVRVTVPLQIQLKYNVMGQVDEICALSYQSSAFSLGPQTRSKGSGGFSKKSAPVPMRAMHNMPESIKSVKESVTRGINTVGSSLKNATYNIFNVNTPGYVESTSMDECAYDEADEDLFGDITRNPEDIVTDRPTKKTKTDSPTTPIIYQVKKTIADADLPPCVFIGKYLNGAANGVLDVELKVDDVIKIEKVEYQGIYKVIAEGSSTTPWVLEKLD